MFHQHAWLAAAVLLDDALRIRNENNRYGLRTRLKHVIQARICRQPSRPRRSLHPGASPWPVSGAQRKMGPAFVIAPLLRHIREQGRRTRVVRVAVKGIAQGRTLVNLHGRPSTLVNLHGLLSIDSRPFGCLRSSGGRRSRAALRPVIGSVAIRTQNTVVIAERARCRCRAAPSKLRAGAFPGRARRRAVAGQRASGVASRSCRAFWAYNVCSVQSAANNAGRAARTIASNERVIARRR